MHAHITVICDDEGVKQALSETFKLMQSWDLHITWLTSAEQVKQATDLAIVYTFPPDAAMLYFVLPLFSQTRTLIIVTRGQKQDKVCPLPKKRADPWRGTNIIVRPFDPKEVVMRISHMLTTERTWYPPWTMFGYQPHLLEHNQD